MNDASVERVKVFISWSGQPSQAVAKALREGIRTVFDRVIPFVSDVDIDAGTRGLQVIESELQDSAFGIIVVTPENMKAPWLNFEAGALSKALADAASRVVPLLVGLSSASQLTGPLAQFQARTTSESSIRDLFHTLGDSVSVDRDIVRHRLAGWLPGFLDLVESVQGPTADSVPERSSEDLLGELLDLVRSLRRGIRTPKTGTISRAVRSDRAAQALRVTQGHETQSRIRSLLKAHDLVSHTMIDLEDDTWLVPLTTHLERPAIKALQDKALSLGLQVIFASLALDDEDGQD